MLTSRAANKDRIKGLEFGVDDYVTKAYSVKELVVKVAAILWHRQPLEVAPQRLTLGARKLNSVSQEITIKRRRPERLTTLEFKLISVLACGTVATPPRQKLLSDFWGYALNTDSSTPDSHVRLLRSKLQPLASKVETVQGISYRLVE
jgi:DNA-binding response OmpR family regulator